MDRKILILTDFKGYIGTSLLPNQNGTLSGKILKKYFEEKGYLVEIKNLHELNTDLDWGGWYVIYPSNEASGLFYKEFIEDVILKLQIKGAILLPDFNLFRAHHNKVFEELYRTLLQDDRLKTVKSYIIYSPNDIKYLRNKIVYPIVIKTSQGAGSSGVAIANSELDLIKKIYRMGKVKYSSMNWNWYKEVHFLIGTLKRKILKQNKIIKTPQREKIVLQTFISGLNCDYKVLVFGSKYYLLRREIRKNDFRASGSGKMFFPENLTMEEEKVLELAKTAYEEINQPLLSIDIAYDGKECHMIEFQCISFGPYTLQKSKWYFTKNSGKWVKVIHNSILEEEMANAVDLYVKQRKDK